MANQRIQHVITARYEPGEGWVIACPSLGLERRPGDLVTEETTLSIGLSGFAGALVNDSQVETPGENDNAASDADERILTIFARKRKDGWSAWCDELGIWRRSSEKEPLTLKDALSDVATKIMWHIDFFDEE